jgi:hypothetical protein
MSDDRAAAVSHYFNHPTGNYKHFGRIAENAKNNAVCQTALAAVFFLSAAGTASDNYLPISSDGRNPDCVSGL